MRQITNKNIRISSILAFALVPMSGLATDIYLPSFPEMAQVFHTDAGGIQLTMVCFLMSFGISQFFTGSILDSFGRYRLSLLALLVFAASNFVIIHTRDLQLVYGMRILQGVATAFIAVAKRAFFVDAYSGEKRKHYTGMLTIVWATAPIVAPFIGGFLQKSFGWASNFYMLGAYALLMFALEALFSGESLKKPQPFYPTAIFAAYKKLFSATDFRAGVFILGFNYSMVMVLSMSTPFIVEQLFHLSPVVSGYCALFTGASLFTGGLIGKNLKWGKLYIKATFANILQLGIISLMFISGAYYSSLILLIGFAIAIHVLGGFLYNLFFTYCLTRFPENAGLAGGITSGGSYLITSIASSLLFAFISVHDQQSLAIAYFVLSLTVCLIIYLGRKKFDQAGKTFTS